MCALVVWEWGFIYPVRDGINVVHLSGFITATEMWRGLFFEG